MIELIQHHTHTIQQLCEQYRVGKLWVFGSATDPLRFGPESDIDFLYTFDVQEGYDPHFPYAALWSGLLDDLRSLLGQEIQLIAYGPFHNPWFRQQVEATKLLIYDQATSKMVV